jgi:hypothetical protein
MTTEGPKRARPRSEVFQRTEMELTRFHSPPKAEEGPPAKVSNESSHRKKDVDVAISDVPKAVARTTPPQPCLSTTLKADGDRICQDVGHE